MKSIFNFIALILVSLLFESCSETTAGTQKPNISAKQVEVSKMLAEERRINEEQQGICDTCKTGVKSVILENRLIAEQILAENGNLKRISDSIRAEKNRYVVLLQKLKDNRENYERDFQEYTSVQSASLVTDNHSYRNSALQNKRSGDIATNKP